MATWQFLEQPVYDITLVSNPAGKGVFYQVGQSSGAVTLDTAFTLFAVPEDTSYTISLVNNTNFINWTINGIPAGTGNSLTSTVTGHVTISANYSS